MAKISPQSLQGTALDFFESAMAEHARRERLRLTDLFGQMGTENFSLQSYLHDNKTLIQDIGRKDDFLARALIDMSREKHLTQNDAHTILCALFEVNVESPWPTKKATRFVDLLVQLTAAGQKKSPQSQLLAGNLIFSTQLFTMGISRLNERPSLLISLLERVVPREAKGTMGICEILTGKYAGDFSFVFVPVLCELFGQDPKITHMAWRRLLKRPEDHPQWREAVFDLSKIAKSYEDKKALDSALADTLAQKGTLGKPLKL